jgi:hypothetical protein
MIHKQMRLNFQLRCETQQPYAANGRGWQSRADSLGEWGQGKRLTWPS